MRDIKTTERNGKVIGISSVNDDDELLLMTAKGKIQRIKCSEISTIGRNTQGVRIMRLKDDDTLATIVRVPRDELENEDGVVEGKVVPPTADAAATDDVKPEVKPEIDTDEGAADSEE